MKALRQALALTALAFCFASSPVMAATTHVFDSAGLLQPATVESLNTRIDALENATGKAVVVDIVDSTGGMSARDFAAAEFQKHAVNGVMIFVSKVPKSVGVIGDKQSATIFPPGSFGNIRSAIRASFSTGKYDDGISTGVGLIIDTYQSHAGALRHVRRTSYEPATQAYMQTERPGVNWLLIIGIGIAVFFIIRAVSRAMQNGMNGGYGGGVGPGYGGPGYGGPGYGAPGYGAPGYGAPGGGGGGFFSSLLGGLGGAFLGNELFNSMNRGQENNFNQANMFDANSGQEQSSYDAGAFQNDAGQADMGNSSFGDWGDSGGGGGDSGGGGGDNSGW